MILFTEPPTPEGEDSTEETPPPQTTLAPKPPPTNVDADEPLPLVPIIVGSVLGGGLFVGVLVAVSYYFCMRQSAAAIAASTTKLV